MRDAAVGFAVVNVLFAIKDATGTQDAARIEAPARNRPLPHSVQLPFTDRSPSLDLRRLDCPALLYLQRAAGNAAVESAIGGSAGDEQAADDRGVRAERRVPVEPLEPIPAPTFPPIPESERARIAEAAGPWPEADWLLLQAQAQHWIGTPANFVACRPGLERRLGSLAAISDWYRDVVPASFAGKICYVHASLAARLARADAKLGEVDPTLEVWQTVARIDGTSVRPNENKRDELSLHSFGLAIDVNPPENPNVSQSRPKDRPPARVFWLVSVLLGVDVHAPGQREPGDEAHIDVGDYERDRAEAGRLRKASDDFKAIFESETTVSKAMWDYLNRCGAKLDSLTPELLFEYVREIYDGSSPGLRSRLSEQLFPSEGAPLASLPAEAAVAAAAAAVPVGAIGQAVGAEAAPRLRHVGFLVDVYRTFVESRGSGSSGPVPAQATPGGAGSIAAHGFMNLDPRVVATLTAGDGGGLYWLGGCEDSTKDFMHFELRSTR